MIFGSVCSGIEAASVAWHPLGWRAAFVSEIEAFPRAVLAHRWPDTPLHGDFTTIEAGQYEPIDLLVGGTPCQSFSVAGLRGGLADGRGNLALEYLRLADRLRPRWLVWENVPGVLSSNAGRDFGAILGGMVELGYGFAYRVLDAQYFGVAQRRRRVFVVGHAGDWRRAAAVLFERASLSGHPAPRREKGEGIAPGAGEGVGGGAGLGDGPRAFRDVSPTVCRDSYSPTKCMEGDEAAWSVLHPAGAVEAFGGGNRSGPIEAAATLTAKGNRQDFEVETFAVTHSLRGEGFDASEDGTGRGTPIVPVAFQGRGSNIDLGQDVTGTIGQNCDRASGGAPCVAFAIQERAVCENPDAGPDGARFRGDGAAYTLEARTVPQAVAFALRGREDGAVPEVNDAGDSTGALRAASGGSSRDYVAFAQNTRDEVRVLGVDGSIAGAIGANEGMKQRTYLASAASAVRRLTPTECERLQGFPLMWESLSISICFDRQKCSATAEISCRKWPGNAWPADAGVSMRPAPNVERPSTTAQENHGGLVLVLVPTPSGGEEVAILSPERWRSLASGVGPSGWCRPPIPHAATVPGLAAPWLALARLVRNGAAALPQNIRLSTPAENGERSAPSSGGVSAVDANGAISGPPKATFTTFALGPDTPPEGLTLATSLCSALSAIAGFIPAPTSSEPFSLSIVWADGYTDIPWRGRQTAPDGPRYKALGNSMAVPVMRWIGERIAAVEALP